jgi:putative ABC transport system permease protein
MNGLLRLALGFCPREFRDKFESDVAYDAMHAGRPVFAQAADVFAAGVAMHVESFWRDLIFAMRTLSKSRMYATVVIAAVALAIACNAAVGSVLEGIVLRPLPYPNADRLVNISYDVSAAEFSYPDSRDFRARQHTLQAFGIRYQDSATLSRITPPVTVEGSQIDEGYFTVLGAHAQIGRLFTAADSGRNNVVISDALWRRYFGAGPAVIGRTLTLDDKAYRIIGVVQAGFRDISPQGLNTDDYWLPIDPRGMLGNERGYNSSDAWGLLRPGVSVAAADADAMRVVRDIVHRYPAERGSWSASSVTLALDQIVGPVRSMVWLTYAAAFVLLVIACANVINLTLVRAAARERELVMRTALGASRARIAAQLTTEMALLAAAGGAIGLLVGWTALRLFAALGTQLIPRWQDVHMDLAVVAYVCALLVLTTIATGVAPAVLHRLELSTGLKAGGRSGDLSGAKRVRVGIVIAEIALALSLVIAAGLMLRSFVTLTRANLGFDPHNVYAIALPSFSSAQYAKSAARVAAIERLVSALRATPGILDATSSRRVPFINGMTIGTDVPGRTGREIIQGNAIDGGYFRLMRIPMLRGRDFTPLDGPHAQSVAIVNATFAKHFFGTLDVVGRRIEPGTRNEYTPSSIRTIVGVVGDTRNHFSEPMKPEFYLPEAQLGHYNFVVARAASSHFPVGATAKRVFASVAPSLAPPVVYSYDALFQEDAGRWQAAALLFGVLAVAALLLALAGIYAVTSYSVSQRTQEFGIRKAVGASNGNVLSAVMADTLKQAAVGITLGVVLAAASTQLLQPLLFQTSAFDPLTYVTVVALIAGCAICAALVPAIRATRVQPASALRYE